MSATRRPARLRAEPLEDRATPATFTVTNPVDDGQPGNLRAAIARAEQDFDPDTIEFAPQLAGQFIGLNRRDSFASGPSYLEVVTPITIRGTGQTIGPDDEADPARLFVVIAGNDGGGDLTLSDLTLTGGRARDGDQGGESGRGGAILNLNGTVRLFGCTLTGNSAAGNPGIAGEGGGLPGGYGLGGAIYNDRGAVVVVDSTLDGNTAAGGPSGAGGTFAGPGLGGAIYNDGGSVLVANSTVSSNTARGGDALAGGGGNDFPSATHGGDGLGGGLYTVEGEVTLTNVTVAGNLVLGGAGVSDGEVGGPGEAAGSAVYNLSDVDGSPAAVGVGNSILTGSGGSSAAPVVNDQRFAADATITGTGPNIVTAAIDNRGGTVDGAAFTVADPVLGPLQNNGGPTATMAPGAGSPALDAGDDALLTAGNFGGAVPDTDQRGTGFARVAGGELDLGAVEFVGQSLTLTPPTLPGGVVGVPYRQTVTVLLNSQPLPAEFSVAAGVLPPGLTLVGLGCCSEDGATEVAGTPTAAGAYTFTLAAVYGEAPPISREYTVTVAPAPRGEPLVLAPDGLPGGQVGTPYRQTVTALFDGQPAGAVFTVTAGSLPPGLALGTGGFEPSGAVALAGTPTAAGAYTFTVEANADGPIASRAYTVTVAPAPVAEQPPANTPPTIADVADRTVTFNQTTGAVSFAVGDAETPAAALAVAFTTSDPALLPPGSVTLGGAAGSRTVTVTPAAGRSGTAAVTLTVTDAGGLSAADTFTVTVPPVPQPLAVGGSLNTRAAVYTPTRATGQYEAAPAVTADLFGAAAANVRTAVADVDGDGYPDAIMVTGPGTPTRFAVVSGKDNTTVLIPPTPPFSGSEGFTGGGLVTAADLDGDGRCEVVLTPDFLGGPRVVVFALRPGGAAERRANFLGIEDADFRGGCRSALGDVNGDGTPDLVVTAGFPGGPRAALYDGATLAGTPARLVGDFFAFDGADVQTLRYGAFVAAGDVDGDGFADLVFGGGPGGAPRVFALSGKAVMERGVVAAQAAPVANFYVAGNDRDRDGVRVAATDADGDGRADVVAGSGDRTAAGVRVYLGRNVGGSGEPAAFQDLDPFAKSVLANGVYVG